MNRTQKILAALACWLIVIFAFYLHAQWKLSESVDIRQRETVDLKNIKDRGELVYQFQRVVEEQNRVIDAENRGDLDMNNILKLINKQGLKSPANSKESLSTKRTYQEKIIALKFKDEALKSIILFLLDVEALGNVKVSKLDIMRNPRDPDLWNCDLSIVRRLKKDIKN